MFRTKSPGKVDIAAKALATACGVAHATFFGIFAWRVIGRSGFGVVAWITLAAVALLGIKIQTFDVAVEKSDVQVKLAVDDGSLRTLLAQAPQWLGQ